MALGSLCICGRSKTVRHDHRGDGETMHRRESSVFMRTTADILRFYDRCKRLTRAAADYLYNTAIHTTVWMRRYLARCAF